MDKEMDFKDIKISDKKYKRIYSDLDEKKRSEIMKDIRNHYKAEYNLKVNVIFRNSGKMPTFHIYVVEDKTIRETNKGKKYIMKNKTRKRRSDCGVSRFIEKTRSDRGIRRGSSKMKVLYKVRNELQLSEEQFNHILKVC